MTSRTVSARYAPALSGAQRAGRPEASTAVCPSAAAAAKSVPPGALARSTIRLCGRSAVSTGLVNTGAGMVFTTVSKPGAAPASSASGIASAPWLAASARWLGYRLEKERAR